LLNDGIIEIIKGVVNLKDIRTLEVINHLATDGIIEN
jgi:hypothetical protein